jgi:hypothetical protein
VLLPAGWVAAAAVAAGWPQLLLWCHPVCPGSWQQLLLPWLCWLRVLLVVLLP